MKIISHRGYLEGPNPDKENNPQAVEECLSYKFDVEIDLRMLKGKFFLGHDEAIYEITVEWLYEYNEHLWIHCKNKECLENLNSFHQKLNFFWHENDSFTITSKNYIWAYPSKEIFKNAINVLPEINIEDTEIKKKKNILGICTDYPKMYSSLLEDGTL